MEPITIIIESPKGSGHKYDFEPELNRFKLKKILPAGMVFPFDFGFIPDTKGEDGDPLDVMVLSEISGFPGCCMDCRIIGAIKVDQTGRDGKTIRNDRYFAVPEASQLYSNINSIHDLPEAILNQIESFFKNYNEPAGKELHIVQRVNGQEAYQMIKSNASSF
ncbi:inorganic diphosphatase [Mucilaginibacter sp.]|jgi:inorganic pyrophosphatase|uniref:inorganic diphosphatase n=1 Tax=Mucilaginibacter sp. TaxID=1882438 RepID=UPI003568911C